LHCVTCFRGYNPSWCNCCLYRRSFIGRNFSTFYLTTCFGLTGHLQVWLGKVAAVAAMRSTALASGLMCHHLVPRMSQNGTWFFWNRKPVTHITTSKSLFTTTKWPIIWTMRSAYCYMQSNSLYFEWNCIAGQNTMLMCFENACNVEWKYGRRWTHKLACILDDLNRPMSGLGCVSLLALLFEYENTSIIWCLWGACTNHDSGSWIV
jgi:hypothetical protein